MHRPIALDKWRQFLRSKGYTHQRTKNHEIWESDPPGLRPVVFQPSKKQIPATHIKTCLRTMGVEIDELEKFLDKKKKKDY